MKYVLILLFSPLALMSQPKPLAEPVPVPAPSREMMLKNLVQAGILMLEGGAYRQFVQTFLREEERGRFEKDFGKGAAINYAEWGSQKGERLLKVMKAVADKTPVVTAERACFAAADAPGGYFSFLHEQGGWYIENNSRKCQPSTPVKPAAQPDKP